LLARARDNVAQYHAKMGLSDEQLQGIITQGAYEVQPVTA